MTHEEFVHYQREIHRPLLMSIPEAKQCSRDLSSRVPRSGMRLRTAEYTVLPRELTAAEVYEFRAGNGQTLRESFTRGV